MDSSDPRYDQQACLLLEAGRLNPTWGRTVWDAATPEDVDRLVEQATAIVEEAAREAY